MPQKTLLRPFEIVDQGRLYVFDTVLGQGGHNIAFLSRDKTRVAKFQVEHIKSLSDNPLRQQRLLEEHYDENLAVRVVEYRGDRISVRNEYGRLELIAARGESAVLMSYCPHTLPSDDEIWHFVIDEVVDHHRVISDAHIPGNVIKLKREVGKLKKDALVLIDVAAAFKYGRDRSLPRQYSQVSFDEIAHDGLGMRVALRHFYNDILGSSNAKININTQRTVKALFFCEELYPKFHHQLSQLHVHPAWITVLSGAYHLFPYGSGLPEEIRHAEVLDQSYIDALHKANEMRMSYFERAFRVIGATLPVNSAEKLSVISNIAYVYDQLARRSVFTLLNEMIGNAYSSSGNAQRIKDARSKIKSCERVLRCFDAFGLLEAVNLTQLIQERAVVLNCVELMSQHYITWTKPVAEFVLQHSQKLNYVFRQLEVYASDTKETIEKCLRSDRFLDAVYRCINRLTGLGALNARYLSDVLRSPDLVLQVFDELETVGMFFPYCIDRLIKDPRMFLTAVQILKPINLMNRTNVTRLLGNADFSKYVELLGQVRLSTPANIQRLLDSMDWRQCVSQIILEKALASGAEVYRDDVKIFACKELLAEASLSGVDVKTLLMIALRVLTVGQNNGLAMWCQRFDWAQLGETKIYYEHLLRLQNVCDFDWQGATHLRDYEYFRKQLEGISAALSVSQPAAAMA